jgi:protein-disulfide isomerase
MRFAALMLVLVAAAPVAAAEFTADQRTEIVSIIRDAMKQDPSILRDAITALQADEGAREQAHAQDALAGVRDKLVSPADPVAGNPNGDVTIVEFFDVRCPYCKRIEPVMAQFLTRDKGVRLVYKDLPILGPASTLGSKALLAAQRQNAYEKLRDAVMKLPPDITTAMLQTEVKKLGLDWTKLSRDMEDATVKQQIDANLALAHTLNIQGTPALIIGNEIVPGAIDIDELTRLVAAARQAKG